MKKVTMRDIAKEMGVSTVSVSKALADKDGVSETMREKIKEKAAELGYDVAASKGVADTQRNNVCVIVPERFFSDSSYYANLYKLLVKDFSAQGYMCSLEILSDEDEENCVAPMAFYNPGIDGLVLLGQLSKDYIKKYSGMTKPYICLDFYNEKYLSDFVVGDGVYGAYILTKYLIKKGINDIVFVGDIHATSSILDRYVGYVKAMLEYNADMSKLRWINDRDENGRFIKIQIQDKLPEAYLCNCDEVGYHLVNGLKEQGIRVPEDVSVAAFDDSIYSRICDPQLTVYRVDMEMMSYVTVSSLIGQLTDDAYRKGRKVIGGGLVKRGSVKEKR